MQFKARIFKPETILGAKGVRLHTSWRTPNGTLASRSGTVSLLSSHVVFDAEGLEDDRIDSAQLVISNECRSSTLPGMKAAIERMEDLNENVISAIL